MGRRLLGNINALPLPAPKIPHGLSCDFRGNHLHFERNCVESVIKDKRRARTKSVTFRKTAFVKCNLHRVNKYQKDLRRCQDKEFLTI